jgi:hypothetical protein
MLIQKLIHVNSQAPVTAIEVQQKKRGPKPKQANENRAEIKAEISL